MVLTSPEMTTKLQAKIDLNAAKANKAAETAAKKAAAEEKKNAPKTSAKRQSKSTQKKEKTVNFLM